VPSLYRPLHRLDLPSFPTRRSSDLKTGYRKAALCSFLVTIIGLTGFYYLPFVISPYLGILICMAFNAVGGGILEVIVSPMVEARSEEHTSELQSRFDLVCRLLLEKK